MSGWSSAAQPPEPWTAEKLRAAMEAEDERSHRARLAEAERASSFCKWWATLPDDVKAHPDVQHAAIYGQMGVPMHPNIYKRAMAVIEPALPSTEEGT